MASYPHLKIEISEFITPTKLQEKLLKILNDEQIRQGINQIIGDRANKYVPMESGALRESMRVDSDAIHWGEGLDYARYQYGGEVYGPNRPITYQGRIVGWYSPAGVKKSPTGRTLGVPGMWKGWKFGYKTPGTTHHWIDEMLQNERRAMNVQITAYLKREARKRNK